MGESSFDQESFMPLISVIIVAYKSQSDLEVCLPSLYNQTFKSIEIIVVDNTPQSSLQTWLNQAHPSIRYIKSLVNGGYAAGNNLGTQHALGEFVLLLNPDTELSSTALEQLYNTACQYPKAFINPKLLQPNGTLNAVGNEMHYTGITTCKGLGDNPQRYTGIIEIPLLSGAAIFAPRTVLEDVGGFDETYFMYFEDTDFSLRARLKSYRLLCNADVEIIHHYKLGMSVNKFYYLERNRLLTLFKIYEASTLRHILLPLLITEACMAGFALTKGFSYVAARFKVYIWLLKNYTVWQSKRSGIQASRTLPDTTLLNDSLYTLKTDQVVKRSGIIKKINNLLDFFYYGFRPRGVK
jgi:GT2 family glycosyltransferase